MYLIDAKGVKVEVNREVSFETILNQLPELNDKQLQMTADYIHGLRAADKF